MYSLFKKLQIMNLKNYILEAKEQENLPEILDFVTNIISQYTDSLSDLSDYSEENFKKWCEDNGIGDMGWDDKAKKSFYSLCCFYLQEKLMLFEFEFYILQYNFGRILQLHQFQFYRK